MRLKERGFTLIEMVVVIILLAVIASITVPRAIRVSPAQQVDRAARSLMRDLEQIRMGAIAAKRTMRVRFYESDAFYSAFIDMTADRSGTVSEVAEEVRASGLLTRGSKGGLPGVELLKGVRFGPGAATSSPLGGSIQGAIDVGADYLEFNARGLVIPDGGGGVIYLVHEEDPSAVSAITISGASAFRTFRLIEGAWVK
jgi:prepilin-type N-terminal cleavage/methylation domain-containing protein